MDKMKNIKSLTIVLQPKSFVAHPEFLHNTISFVILLAQFFGLMPIYGIRGKDYSNLKFRWKSLRFLYTVFNLSGAFTSAIFCCLQFAMMGLMLDKTGKM